MYAWLAAAGCGGGAVYVCTGMHGDTHVPRHAVGNVDGREMPISDDSDRAKMLGADSIWTYSPCIQLQNPARERWAARTRVGAQSANILVIGAPYSLSR